MGKKELQVAAIENGTVIDHIPAEKTYEVAKLLNLQNLSVPEEINRLSVVAPKIVLNIIRNYEVVEKKTVETPDELHGIIKCNNPKCITNNEPMQTYFTVVDKVHGIVKCHYCDKEQKLDDVQLV